MEKRNKPDREYITSLERGLQVLRCFSRETPEMTISEISAVTGLNPAVVRRCLHTFLYLGYVGKKGKFFLLRPQVMSLGSAYLESMNVEESFRPTLQELSDRMGDSTSLSVLAGNDLMVLVYVSTAPTIHHYMSVGKRIPAYVTALGRSLLAHRPKEELDRYLSELQPVTFTDKTITSVPRLRKLLHTVQKQNWACVYGEFDPLVVSLAIPIFSAEGYPVAAINCSTSTTRADEKLMVETRLPHLREAGRKIEMELRRLPLLAHSINSGK